MLSNFLWIGSDWGGGALEYFFATNFIWIALFAPYFDRDILWKGEPNRSRMNYDIWVIIRVVSALTVSDRHWREPIFQKYLAWLFYPILGLVLAIGLRFGLGPELGPALGLGLGPGLWLGLGLAGNVINFRMEVDLDGEIMYHLSVHSCDCI